VLIDWELQLKLSCNRSLKRIDLRTCDEEEMKRGVEENGGAGGVRQKRDERRVEKVKRGTG
jgi:hypothetical protein